MPTWHANTPDEYTNMENQSWVANPEIEAVLAQVARRYHADVQQLRQALEDESAAELAAVLQIDRAAAEERMAKIQRAVVVQSDWGAGCKLLSDDVRAELVAALRSF